MQPLNNILKKFVKDFGLDRGVTLNVIKERWASIVGQTIRVHTFPDIIKGKTLTLIVDTPQWMHHLSFYKEEICKKLEPYSVTEIRFRLGRLPERTAVHKQKDPLLTAEDSRYIENTLKIIKDGELKEKIRTLLVHGLTKGKK